MMALLINQELGAPDTVLTDSIKRYEIPQIIEFGGFITRGLNQTFRDINPNDYPFRLIDAFYRLPFMFYDYGTGQTNLISSQGLDPRYTAFFLNGHRLINPLSGYVNLTKLPIQFFERIVMGENFGGFGLGSVNLISKVNHYDLPYSYVRYGFGSYGIELYDIDFTRPITNEFGFYLSGRHFDYAGYQSHSSSQINSIYANLYYDHFMRFDAIYFSNEYEIPGFMLDANYGQATHEFYDLSLTAGLRNHKISIYFNSDNEAYTYSSSTTSVIRNFGLQTESYNYIQGFDLSYGLFGQQGKVTDDLYGTHSPNSIAGWAQCEKHLKDFIFSISGLAELVNAEDFFCSPEISFGIELLDSTYIMAGLDRGYRMPTIQENWQHDSAQELLPEYYWHQEISLQSRNFLINLYKLDFADPIFAFADSLGYEFHENRTSRQTIGITGYFEIPFYFGKSAIPKSINKISLGYTGNYLLKNDSVAFIPKGISSFFVSLDHTTERFGAKLALEQRYVSTRHDLLGQDLAEFRVFSLAGMIRVVTLSGTVRVDNIFDEDYNYLPNSPMPPRSFSAAIKWEFWN